MIVSHGELAGASLGSSGQASRDAAWTCWTRTGWTVEVRREKAMVGWSPRCIPALSGAGIPSLAGETSAASSRRAAGVAQRSSGEKTVWNVPP